MTTGRRCRVVRIVWTVGALAGQTSTQASLMPVSFARQVECRSPSGHDLRFGPLLGPWTVTASADHMPPSGGNQYFVRASQMSDMTTSAVSFDASVAITFIPPTFLMTASARVRSEGTAVFDIATPQAFRLDHSIDATGFDRLDLFDQNGTYFFRAIQGGASPFMGTLPPGRYTLHILVYTENLGAPINRRGDAGVLLTIPAPGSFPLLVVGAAALGPNRRRQQPRNPRISRPHRPSPPPAAPSAHPACCAPAGTPGSADRPSPPR